MAAWRMAFRIGIGGESMWPACRRLGIAAIGYDDLSGIDLSICEQGEPKDSWSRLASGPRTSMKRFVYTMKTGDTIYVKHGPKIVGKGTVTGAYTFDELGLARVKNGNPWQHQRPVSWHNDFPEVVIRLGDAQQFTVEELDADDLSRLDLALHELGWSAPAEFSLREEVPWDSITYHGGIKQVWVNAYERSAKAREQCIAAHGRTCDICKFNFGATYGPVAEKYIHVHHLRPLSEIGESHVVDSVADLRPVCPNCHGVLHLRIPAYSIEDVRGFIVRQAEKAII